MGVGEREAGGESLRVVLEVVDPAVAPVEERASEKAESSGMLLCSEGSGSRAKFPEFPTIPRWAGRK